MTGTGLTRYHGLPYPPSPSVRGNGATDIEALAVKTDAELDKVSANWTVVNKPDSAIYTCSAAFTGLLANNTYPTLFLLTYTNVKWGTNPPGFVSNAHIPETWAWYSVSVSISSIPSGAATASSRRTMTVKVFDASGSLTPAQTFIREDYELGSGETILQLEFVAFFGQNYQLEVDFFHANTGSTVNITTTSTYVAMNRIMGAN